ncbi:MAG: hypothetical protein RMX96_15480 [Nostoc sp. ChiSLP02]|nr:hypothetical protein [Nostoc sp. DedSLP05]MDZ8101814.1 hypothetical protein [Nostoc sp. DedSLP01]MDZ8186243.1 hypothetical protein [Nostoc sp. ChiSLP02]
MSYKAFQTKREYSRHWVGFVRLTPSPFRVIARPNLFRRQLHFENFNKCGIRKRKGGTVTQFRFRSGDFVQGEKAIIFRTSLLILPVETEYKCSSHIYRLML